MSRRAREVRAISRPGQAGRKRCKRRGGVDVWLATDRVPADFLSQPPSQQLALAAGLKVDSGLCSEAEERTFVVLLRALARDRSGDFAGVSEAELEQRLEDENLRWWQDVLAEQEAAGTVEQTGRSVDGEPIYHLTEAGRAAADQAREALKA